MRLDSVPKQRTSPGEQGCGSYEGTSEIQKLVLAEEKLGE
jgi:hypothetical protein